MGLAVRRRPAAPTAPVPHPFLSTRAPASPPTASGGEASVDEAPVATWTAGSRWAATVATAGLWALVVCGPAALAVTLTAERTPPPAAPPAQQVVDSAPQQAAASELARQLVTGWLTLPRGEEDQLAQFVDTAELTLPHTPWQVADVAVAGLTGAGDGQWSVTVGATVTDVDGTSARRYFAVPVQVDPTSGGVAALTLPAAVPAPPVAALPALAYPYTTSTTSDVAVTAHDFLTALLTGTGDLTRYLTPGAALTAVDDAPYATVEVTQVWVDVDPTDLTPQQGLPVRALVTATATTLAGQTAALQYALQVQPREGRWEVAAIDDVPATTPTDADVDTGPAPAPSLTPPATEAGASPEATPAPTPSSEGSM